MPDPVEPHDPSSNPPTPVMTSRSDGTTRAWQQAPIKAAARITLIYLLAAAAWMLLSDSLADSLMLSQEQIGRWTVLKGTVFVVLTSGLLFYLVQRFGSRLSAANQRLTGQERQYRLLFATSPQPMWLYDLDSLMFIAVNDAAVAYYGYSRAEFLAMSIKDIRPETEIPALMAEVAGVTDGLQHDGIWRHRRKNGDIILVETSYQCLRFNDRNAVLVVAHDVTERVQLAQQLKLSAMAFEYSREMMMMVDAQGHIMAVNPALTSSTHYSAEEVVGRTAQTLFVTQEHDASFAEIWAALQAQGQWQGEVWQGRKDGSTFHAWLSATAFRDEGGNVQHVVLIATDLTERKRVEAQLYRLTHYDALTGLPNRLLLQQSLAIAIATHARSSKPLVLCYIDITDFTRFSESYGPSECDRVVVEVASRLKASVRTTDILARWGGDQFVVVIRQSDHEEAATIAERLLQVIAEPYDYNGTSLSLSASIGVSLYPHDGQNAEALLRNSVSAAGRARSEGRHSYCFFTEEMNVNAVERLRIEGELRRALREGQFFLHYQPQLCLRSGKLIGLEALIRWQHPQQGVIGPGTFIPVAERSGLIVDIGNWVLAKACQQLQVWRQAGLADVPVAVNLSAHQLRDEGIVDTVKATLAASGLPAHLLELEVTESALVENTRVNLAQCDALKKIGVGLSIDDFGTGYSSLAYLKRLPVQKIKIDQSFVRDLADDPDDHAIAEAIIRMSHSLNLSVIAEGVETVEQARLLREMGCDEGQGFLFAQPMAAQAMASWMAKRVPAAIV